MSSSSRLGLKQTLPKVFFFFFFGNGVRSRTPDRKGGVRQGGVHKDGGTFNLPSTWRDLPAGKKAGLTPYKCREVAAV